MAATSESIDKLSSKSGIAPTGGAGKGVSSTADAIKRGATDTSKGMAAKSAGGGGGGASAAHAKVAKEAGWMKAYGSYAEKMWADAKIDALLDYFFKGKPLPKQPRPELIQVPLDIANAFSNAVFSIFDTIAGGRQKPAPAFG